MVVAKGPDAHISLHKMSINKKARAQRLQQKPAVIWFTGLSGSGKSSIADALERALFAMGYSTYLIDGDNIRHGLCADLGFSDEDRMENIRRAGEVAKLLVDAGQIVIASFISPFARERAMTRRMVEPDEFIEVYVSTPLAVCETRDPKNLYKKARSGIINNFTGIDSPYEPPLDAEVEFDASHLHTEAAVELIVRELRDRCVIR